MYIIDVSYRCIIDVHDLNNHRGTLRVTFLTTQQMEPMWNLLNALFVGNPSHGIHESALDVRMWLATSVRKSG